MKSTILLFFAFSISLSFAQFVKPEQHLCAKHKIEAWQKANSKTSKSLNGQEKYDIHYVKLELDLDNTSTEIYTAKTTIKASVVGVSLDIFVLELLSSLTVDSVKINNISAASNRIGDELQIFPQNSLANGTNFTAEIYYHGTQPTNSNYSEGIFNGQSPSWGADVTYTLSEPFGASTWWPAKQVLTDKIDSSEVWITVPNTLKAGSNGVLMNEVNVSNGKKQFQWKHNHPINYYLLSIAVGPYQDYSFTANLPNNQNILVQNYIYDVPNLFNQFQAEIDKTEDMLVEFSDKFGSYPYANEKYGHCMAPLSGGMEHQTMTTQGFFVESLTAHELGHQWFGNNVTCETWGHIWINEGFASYSEYLFEESYNYQNAQATMQSVHNSVLSQPGGSVYVNNQTNENRIFSSRLSYDKGSALVHMIRHWVNDDQLFFEALKEFQNIYKNSTATAEDFFATVENLAEIDLQNELQHWYYGEGYPTFDVKYNNASSGLVIELSQTGSVASNPFFETSLEIKVDFMDNTDTILRVDNTSNLQQYFFNITKDIYTINIDPNNWILNKIGTITEDDNLTFTNVKDVNDIDFSLFPNPNNGSFTIINPSKNLANYAIYNLLGTKIQEGIINKGNNQITISAEKGIYFIKINDNYNSFILK